MYKHNIKTKILSLVFSIALLVSCLMPLGAVEALAATSEGTAVIDAVDSGTITIDGTEYQIETINVEVSTGSTFNGALQPVLNSIESKDNGKMYRVVVPAGSYDSTQRIYLGSNTILDLRGVEIYNWNTATDNINETGSGFDGCQNIIILGGELHGLVRGQSAASHKISGGASTCNTRIGHAKNISIVGSKFYDNCGGHLVEVGGVKNLLIADCEFTGYADPDPLGASSQSLEAIQLDVIHRDKMNFEAYDNKDDSSVENATIVGNYFHDLRRGVGSHHAVYGHPYNNIKIAGNTFKNILDKAIQLEYCTNSSVSYNEMTNVTCGISVNSAFAGSFYLPNSASERNSLSVNKTIYANTTIANNKIYLNTSAVSGEKWADKSKYGIRVFGESITSSNNKQGYEDSTATLPPTGIYYISGVNVKDNTITTVNNAGTNNIECGIRARYAKNCTISGNTVNNQASSGVKDGFGISLLDTNGCTVKYNAVTRALNGIGVNGGSYDKIENNTVNSCYKNGITVLSSVVSTVNANKISYVPENGIAISNSATANNINYNSIWGGITQGISVSGSAKAGTIYSNSISGAKKNGISITSSSRVNNTISTNKVSSSGTNGILIYGKAYAKNIYKNNVNKAGNIGILVYSSATANSISSNTVKKAKKPGICVSSKSTCKGFASNKLTSCGSKNKISIASNSKGIVLNKNTLKLKKGKSSTLKVSAKAANKKKVTWKTSNKKIATVKNGKVTAKKKGTVTITVTQNGVSSKCKVTVK